MANLFMVSGDRSLAEGKQGAFYNTLEEFHKYWDRIDIICPRITNYELQISNLFGNVFIHSSPWPLWLQPLWIYREGFRILKIQNSELEIKNWIMTVHDYPPFYNGLGAKFLFRKLKVPYVLEIMHIPGLPKAGSFKEWIYKWLIRLCIKADASTARMVRVINQKQTPDFLIKSGIKKEKLLYIPAFYIDLEIFRPIPTLAVGAPTDSVGVETYKEYDLVFAARLERNKGIYELLRAISKVKIQIPHVKLLVIGSGPLKPKLEKFIERNNLRNNVTFSGWLATADDVAKAYNSARVFINPSYNEGGPRVVLEAMACGLPVITTPVGLMMDIIKHRQNGLLTEWSPPQMAKTIARLLADEDTQRQFSIAGLELVKKFEKKEAIKNYAEKLQGIIK